MRREVKCRRGEGDEAGPRIVLEFANERSRIIYETVQAVDRIVGRIGPEERELRTSPIRFTAENATRGLTAVMNAGTVVYTSRPGVILIPERSLRILRELGIPYEAASAAPAKHA